VPKQTVIELILEDGQIVGSTSRVNAALQSIEDKAQHLGEHPGFDKFAEGVKGFIEDPLHSAGEAMEGILQKMGPWGAGVAAAFSVITVGAEQAVEAMEKFASLGVQTQNVTLKTGLLTREVGEFAFAAKAVGSDITIVERLMRGLTMAIEGTDEKSAKARETLRGMGVDVAGLRDGTASTSDTLKTLSEHLSAMTNVWERNQIMLELFKKSGIEAIPFIMKLSEELKVAHEMGFGLTDDEQAKFMKYQEQLELVSAEWDKLKREMMEPISAVISLVIGDGKGNLVEQVKHAVMNWAVPGWGTPSGILGSLPGADIYVGAKNAATSAVGAALGGAGGFYGTTTPANGLPSLWNALMGDNSLNLAAPGGVVKPGYAAGFMSQLGPIPAAYTTRAQDEEAYSHTLIGAQENLAQATKDAKTAHTNYTDGALKDLPALRVKWDEAKEAVIQYKNEVDSLKEHTKIDKDAVLKLPANYDAAAYAFHRSIIPSLYGPEMAGLNYSDMAYGDMNTTIAAGRSTGNLALYRGMAGFGDTNTFDREEIEKRVSGIEKNAGQDVQLAGAQHSLAMVGHEPDGEVALAQQELDIRMKALKNELDLKRARSDLFDMAKEQYDYDNRAQTARFDFEEKILELRKQEAEQAQKDADTFGKLVVDFSNAAETGGHRGISQFFRGQAHGLEDTMIGNVASTAFKNLGSALIPHMPEGPLGDLLKGTPFAPKSSDSKLLQDATLDNTLATRDNTAAVRAMAMSRSGGGGGLVPGGVPGAAMTSGGGYDSMGVPIDNSSADALGMSSLTPSWAGSSGAPDLSSSAYFSMPAAAALASTLGASPAVAAKLSGMMALSAKLRSVSATTGGFMTGVGQGMSDPLGMLFGSTGPNGGYEGTLTTSQGIGAGIGIAGAGMCVYSGISQMARGGAHNDLAGVGTTLMAIAPLTGPAAPFVEGAGMAASFVSMILGDPRLQRGTQITNWAAQDAYTGPDPVSYARSMSGGTVGTDMFGNSRAVGNQTTITIHAMDSDSFNTFLQNHPTQLDAGMYNVVQNGSKSVPALRQALLGG